MKNKKAINQSEAYKIEEKYTGVPHGWIQWKGTDVCMDIHCKCGHLSHIDASFAYRLRLGDVAETDAQKRDAVEVTMSSKIEKLNGNIAKPLVVGSFVKPHDRFKNAALFLCGYLSYPNERIDEVASIIRRYAALNEPYELCTCQKCKQVVELQFYEGDDEECSYPHYTCPSSQCKAIYYDKSGKERWEELEAHYEDIEERYREQLEDSWDTDEW